MPHGFRGKRDARHNVAILWEAGDTGDHPICNDGHNYRLVAQCEQGQGNRMVVNQRRLIGIVSADTIDRMLRQRLKKVGIDLDDADPATITEMTEIILVELADKMRKKK
ncbi:MAG: hypothetical protein FJ009_06230 [Chloroflexi bacterium]|nr:hypothetical protein [Chloroflexota bacterium]